MGSAHKRVALYLRVSTVDQHPETQLLDLHGLAAQRGYEVVIEYTDKISGAKAKRPGLDQLMIDAHRGKFDLVLVWACDRLARSTKRFVDLLDKFAHLNIEFVSFRESFDTSGPMGRAMMLIIGVIAELERSLIRERVCAGMRRATFEGRRIGRPPLNIDRAAIVRDRGRKMSLTEIAKAHGISRALVSKTLKQALYKDSHKGPVPDHPQLQENRPPETAA
jgi:DNA invertase Pin-like site-specific DNA recombinase